MGHKQDGRAGASRLVYLRGLAVQFITMTYTARWRVNEVAILGIAWTEQRIMLTG